MDSIYATDIATLEDYPDVDRRSCRLLGPIALVVQALMGILVILSLVFKRQREKPKRPWAIWSVWFIVVYQQVTKSATPVTFYRMFDVSKQVAGQMFVHGTNVFISDTVAHHSSGNPCVLYFLNILVDTTLGIGVIYLVLHLVTYLLTEKLQLKGFRSGQYGTPLSIWFWARQAAVYIFALTVMKSSVLGLFALWPGIFKVGAWLLSWTGGGDAVQVIFVMGAFPIMMNVLQFWLIDSIVKASSSDPPQEANGASHSGDHEPLFNSSEFDDDNDDEVAPPRVYDIENPPPKAPVELPSELQATDDEQKSVPSGSGSLHDSPGGAHSYPPSVSTSPRVSRSPEPKRISRKRSPPPPLRPQPPIPQTVIISSSPIPTAELPIQRASPMTNSSHRIHMNNTQVDPDEEKHEWGLSWDDSDSWVDTTTDETRPHVVGARNYAQAGHVPVWGTGRPVDVSS
ncbi:hypothetical protein BD410DRAFT_892923 [Rickenella mellea]|uniref:Uncharacterized protein n=1 Tax=Rickenella mellea TaxID=50990 RepID=A0A4R5XGX3_9AGAM|nr:hypothetical protein BD410DRAFT_892923 [Rickenella mellea]